MGTTETTLVSEPTSESGQAPRQHNAVLASLCAGWKLILSGTLAATALAYGATWLQDPTYTARISFFAPLQAQNSAGLLPAGTQAALGAILGGTSPTRASPDLMASLLISRTSMNRLAAQFDLPRVYGTSEPSALYEQIQRHIRVSVGRKDNVVVVEVDDNSPTRAAAIAAAHVEVLRKINAELALSEAKQRRVFFETRTQASGAALLNAQRELESSGINLQALRTEPKGQAEAYARARTALATAETQLSLMRGVFTDDTPEIKQQTSLVAGLRKNLNDLELNDEGGRDGAYVTAFRQYKYAETLNDVNLRQLAMAKLDEAKEAPVVQVIDEAMVPDRPSKPNRHATAIAAALLASALLAWFVVAKNHWNRLSDHAARARIRAAWTHR